MVDAFELGGRVRVATKSVETFVMTMTEGMFCALACVCAAIFSFFFGQRTLVFTFLFCFDLLLLFHHITTRAL
jgi:hypothetical protein